MPKKLKYDDEEIVADYAIKDSNGNNIADTFASKTYVDELVSTQIGTVNTALTDLDSGSGV